MATTNDSAVVDLGRLKTFKSKLDASIATSSANIATSPLANDSNYKKASADGYEACAMGNNAQAKKAATVALGAGAYAIGTNSVAAGPDAAATGTNSTAIGNNANVTAMNSVAVGSNSIATGASSVAIGPSASAGGGGSIAIGTGSSTNSADSQSVALGISSATTKSNQVSVGNNASGLTRYVSNVRDPVEDQDAATRYWVKNADRSDAIVDSFSINTYSGSGMFDLEANSDLKWVSVSGYTSWNTFNDVWAKMVNLPGGNSNEWWIKTDMRVPVAMMPTKSFISPHPCGLEFFSTYTMPARTFSVLVAVGSDRYIYIGKWTSKPSYGDEPYGIYLDGHRFYL